MGEKLYRPLIKEGDHLVRSSKNPDRVRGQSRDSNNKNPDIVEWEEVDVDESPSREELEFELQKIAYEEKRAEQDRALQRLDNINSGLELLNNALTFLNDNPEVAAALVIGGQKIIHAISNAASKAKNRIKSAFSRKNRKIDEVAASARVRTSQISNVVPNHECSVYDGIVDVDNTEREEMSIEEARSLVIDILANYISMKRNIDRLSKAKINEINMPQLDMNQVLSYMDTIVEKYPALMDKQTSISVLDILNSNNNRAENKKILEVLKIEDASALYDYEVQYKEKGQE